MQAYDGHMNMVLSEVEETIYVVDADEATGQQVVRVSASAVTAMTRTLC